MSHAKFFYIIFTIFLLAVSYLGFSLASKVNATLPYKIQCIDGVEYIMFDSGAVVPHGDELGFQTPCPDTK